jgi:hypothetical protein
VLPGDVGRQEAGREPSGEKWSVSGRELDGAVTGVAVTAAEDEGGTKSATGDRNGATWSRVTRSESVRECSERGLRRGSECGASKTEVVVVVSGREGRTPALAKAGKAEEGAAGEK